MPVPVLRRLLPGALLALLTLLFLWRLAFTDAVLVRGDTFAYFYPYHAARAEALRAGTLPLWTPDLFLGAPLLADPQVGTYYLPDWLFLWLPAPDAVRYSLLLHVWLAAAGTYFLFCHTLAPARDRLNLPALVAALVYAFGGFVSAHVEQVNQLQGLAWLPWLFALLHLGLVATTRAAAGRALLSFMALWALQLFSGHTQTVFISGVGLGLYALAWGLAAPRSRAWSRAERGRRGARALLWLCVGAAGALLLALPQLLPALELTGLSGRGGSGFNPQQATAFSLPLSYIGRALLPAYDTLLFTEYIAFPGVLALGLALVGWRQPGAGRWLVVGLAGVLLALGRYNPVYFNPLNPDLGLAALPGFDLFRVPARWLALFALAVALLAGLGLQRLIHTPALRRAEWLPLLLLPALMLAAWRLPVAPEDLRGPATPAPVTMAAWLAALAGLATLLVARRGAALLPALVALELFLAGQILPLNDPALREVYDAQRFSLSQLQAYRQAGPLPAGRVLSISGLFFDPGDKSTLQARYTAAGMDAAAQHSAFTAVKKQELLFPNLALLHGLPSVDGYGGGVLPTTHYTQFTALLLPPDVPRTVDGRLGELLARPECRGACIPDWHWLALLDVRYLLLDKVYDVWHEDVAYDTAFSRAFSGTAALRYTPPDQLPFVADAVAVLYRHPQAAAPRLVQPAAVAQSPVPLAEAGLWLARYPLNAAQPLREIALMAPAGGGGQVVAVSLVDERSGAFVQLTPAGLRRVFSGDVKIYAPDSATLPPALQPRRAVVVAGVRPVADTWQGSEDALALLRQSPARVLAEVLLHAAVPAVAAPPLTNSRSTFTAYSATDLHVRVETPAAGYLVLHEAWYPGWQATVNGQAAPVYRANILFRAVPVPAGVSEVTLTFRPALWFAALLAGLAAWAGWLALLLALRRR
jgi:hypothetical protein